MLSGFWEEAEEPMARADKETVLDFLKPWEPNTKSLDLTPSSNWLFVEI